MKSSATFWTRFLKADEVSTSCQRRHQARHSHPKDRPLKQLTYVRHSKNPVIFRGRLVGLLVLGALTPTTPIAAQKTASPPAIDASPPSSWRVPPAELQALTCRRTDSIRLIIVTAESASAMMSCCMANCARMSATLPSEFGSFRSSRDGRLPPLLPLFDAVFPLLNPGRSRHRESASAADRAAQ